jgi:hypothetical protein
VKARRESGREHQTAERGDALEEPAPTDIGEHNGLIEVVCGVHADAPCPEAFLIAARIRV